MSRVISRVFRLALVLGTATLVSATAWAAASAPFRLYVGETRTLHMAAKIERIAIGNGKVLSASTLRDRELLLVANDAGDSTIMLWLKGGTQVSYAVSVGGNNVRRIADEVLGLFDGDANVGVRVVGDHVFLEVSDLTTLQAKKLAAVEKAYPQEVITIVGGETNLQERTIHMSAQIVEIRTSALENLGIQWQNAIDGPSAGVAGDVIRNNTFALRPDNQTFSDLPRVKPFRWYAGIATAITSSINLLEQRGDAYTIASPQLTSRCGGKADFTAGGELPIPYASGLGATTVEFKPYGIRLNIEPVCDVQGRIRAKLGAEVSQIDRSVSVLGVPGLLTRKAESELDLIDGQPMIISGLTSLTASEDLNKVPGLGDVPLMGNLFKNRGSNGGRTELVLLITPSVITPQSAVVQEGIRKREALQQRAIDMLQRQKVQPTDIEGAAP